MLLGHVNLLRRGGGRHGGALGHRRRSGHGGGGLGGGADAESGGDNSGDEGLHLVFSRRFVKKEPIARRHNARRGVRVDTPPRICGLIRSGSHASTWWRPIS